MLPRRYLDNVWSGCEVEWVGHPTDDTPSPTLMEMRCLCQDGVMVTWYMYVKSYYITVHIYGTRKFEMDVIQDRTGCGKTRLTTL